MILERRRFGRGCITIRKVDEYKDGKNYILLWHWAENNGNFFFRKSDSVNCAQMPHSEEYSPLFKFKETR